MKDIQKYERHKNVNYKNANCERYLILFQF